jgi:hypothetical protein
MKEEKHKPAKHDCLPCDIPPFSRNNYFTGKLLTERDFTAEQQYAANKLRLHHVALHGWGVVCGLKVTPHPICPALRIVVEPGIAVDGCGREIRITEKVEPKLPHPDLPSSTQEDPCPPEPDPVYSKSDGPEDLEAHPSPSVNLYVCLRYVEWEAELMAAPFSECAQTGNLPNRINESYEFEVVTNTKEPKCFEQVRTDTEGCGCEDSDEIDDSLIERCAKPFHTDCIPLAIIRDYAPGAAVTVEAIDNRTYRRLLPSTTALDLLIRCVLRKIPTRTLTRITDISWSHRGEYHCHDFMKSFIGEHSSQFEVTFDAPIRPEGITGRTFQAIAIRYPEKLDGAGQPEIVPTKVWCNSEKTKACLQIDPHYARNRLDRTSFDLYLMLRCNLVVDASGLPVDGELMAKLDREKNYVAAWPSGDGIPGGLFESWIRVVHRGPNEEGGGR